MQSIVTDPDDIEVEGGWVKVGELRPRAFPALRATLTDEQVLSFGWLALADVACWPQLPATQAHALAQSIEALVPTLAPGATAANSPANTAHRAASECLRFIATAQARLKDPLYAAPVDFEGIRGAVNALASFSSDKKRFWQEWLRRVVETAAVTAPEEACALAIAALRATLTVPVRFEYQATTTEVAGSSRTSGPFGVSIAMPKQGGRLVATVAQVMDLDPVGRKIDAKFSPLVAVDRYRMAYLLRSVTLAGLLDNALLGRYDTVTCTNTSTAEVWRYDVVM